jgi:hypothetical protein
METKHTPGPWTFDDKLGHVQSSKVQRIIAFIAHGGGPESLANGKLIAAAPELLTALERICVESESWHSVHGHGEGSTQCDSICQLIPEMQRAIRHAKG